MESGSAKSRMRSQKGQDLPEMTEDDARAYLERLRWPDGHPPCIHCGCADTVYRLQGKSTRPGLFKCRACKGQFTVTVGTIMEDSHLPLAKWVKAFHMMVSSKKGISALQLQRNLALGSYKTAWHLAHRIRYAMDNGPLATMLKGDVQVDESYVGGRRRATPDRPREYGRGTSKAAVLVMVETDGRAVSHPIERLRGVDLKAAMKEVIDPAAAIVTDELAAYPKAAAEFEGGHHTVNHSQHRYVRSDGRHTNTAESFFALLKRGVYGTFHHVSKQHLHRYCHEFSFRWNGRKATDSERRETALRQIEGKRLFYRQPVGEA